MVSLLRLTTVALAACSSPAPAADANDPSDAPIVGGTWTSGTPVANGAVQETAAVALDGKVYLLGGFDDNEGITDRVQIYDTVTSTWSDGPALPRTLHHITVATDGTTIYIAGALTNMSFDTVYDVYSLAPATQTTWQTLPSLPVDRGRGAGVAAMIGGKLYIASGFHMLMANGQLDVFDPGTNMWTALADMPAPRDHACGGVIDGQLVVTGGRQDAMKRTDTWSYDRGTNAWTPRAPLPTARSGMGCGVIGDTLYVAGGEGNTDVPSGVFEEVEGFHLASNTWTQLTPMPTPKHGVGGAVWDGALYLCGGASKGGYGSIAATDIYRP